MAFSRRLLVSSLGSRGSQLSHARVASTASAAQAATFGVRSSLLPSRLHTVARLCAAPTSLVRQSVPAEQRVSEVLHSVPAPGGPDASADAAITKRVPRQRSMAWVWSELSKARLSASVVWTAGAGFLAAGWYSFSLIPFLAVTGGTMLAAGAAASFNQVLEIPNDKVMQRTRFRPLPAGIVSPQYAVAFGTSLSALSGAVLWFGTDPLTTALGLGNIVLYSFVYTPLKQRTPLNTDVGAVVGAIPPVMGWTAATGGLWAAEPALLAAALFWWQLPHFYSMLWANRHDYADAGYEMVSKRDPEGQKTTRLGLNAALLLCSVPIASAVTGATTSVFIVTGSAMTAWMAHAAWRFWRDPFDKNAATRVKHVSLFVVILLTMLFVMHARLWQPEEKVLWEGYGRELAGDAASQSSGSKGSSSTACRWNPFSDPTARKPESAAAVADAAAAVAAGSLSANASGPAELLQRLSSEARIWMRARCAHELWYLPLAHAAAFAAADSWEERWHAAVDCWRGRTGAFVEGRKRSSQAVTAAADAHEAAAGAVPKPNAPSPAAATAAAEFERADASSSSGSTSSSGLPCLFAPLASLGPALVFAEGKSAAAPESAEAAAAAAVAAAPAMTAAAVQPVASGATASA